MPGCKTEFASYAHGTKGCAVISTSGHIPAKTRIYKGQSFDKANLVWEYGKKEPNPYQLEWNNLIAAIRENNATILGMSALLTTTMTYMKTVIKAPDAEGRGHVKVCVGGAPVSPKFAEDIGADGYAPDAASAVDMFKDMAAILSAEKEAALPPNPEIVEQLQV